MVAVSGSASHGSGGNFLIQSGFSEHSQSGKIGELHSELFWVLTRQLGRPTLTRTLC